MRETCARVLVAALMTGAIATVVGMPALVDTPREPTRLIAAPRSSVERSVRLTAQIVPRHRRSAPRLVTTHTSYRRARRSPAVVHTLIVVHTHRPPTHPRRRQLAAIHAPAPAPPSTPAPAQAPQPESADTAAPADEEPSVPGTSDGPGRHGRGHAYGHDKQDD
jgi:hypothetical protein